MKDSETSATSGGISVRAFCKTGCNRILARFTGPLVLEDRLFRRAGSSCCGTKMRTFSYEEISLLTVLYFPFVGLLPK
jgi:hypothetical protein